MGILQSIKNYHNRAAKRNGVFLLIMTVGIIIFGLYTYFFDSTVSHLVCKYNSGDCSYDEVKRVWTTHKEFKFDDIKDVRVHKTEQKKNCKGYNSYYAQVVTTNNDVINILSYVSEGDANGCVNQVLTYIRNNTGYSPQDLVITSGNRGQKDGLLIVLVIAAIFCALLGYYNLFVYKGWR